jgi:hypothetical protein
MEEIIKALRAHAETHYNEDGWDYLVECFTDEEIEKILVEDNVTTLAQAIEAFDFLKVRNEQREDARVAGGVEDYY